MAYMTTYEACEIISLRSILLSQGAATLLSESERNRVKDHISMATLELALGYIDANVHRPGEVHNAKSMILPRYVTDMCRAYHGNHVAHENYRNEASQQRLPE